MTVTAKAAIIDGYVPPKVKGIAERDRPISTGHCGAYQCGHKSHVQLKPDKKS